MGAEVQTFDKNTYNGLPEVLYKSKSAPAFQRPVYMKPDVHVSSLFPIYLLFEVEQGACSVHEML